MMEQKKVFKLLVITFASGCVLGAMVWGMYIRWIPSFPLDSLLSPNGERGIYQNLIMDDQKGIFGAKAAYQYILQTNEETTILGECQLILPTFSRQFLGQWTDKNHFTIRIKPFQGRNSEEKIETINIHKAKIPCDNPRVGDN